MDGIIIPKDCEARFQSLISARNERALTPEQKQAKKNRLQEKQTIQFADQIRQRFPSMPEDDVIACAQHSTEIGSGRVGRSSVAEDPIYCAVKAYARHNYTEYEEKLWNIVGDYEDRQSQRDDIRREIAGSLAKIIDEWQR